MQLVTMVHSVWITALNWHSTVSNVFIIDLKSTITERNAQHQESNKAPFSAVTWTTQLCSTADQWRTQKIFIGGVVKGHMVAICIWCALFVTSLFDLIYMFPNQRFGEVCWRNNAYFSTSTPLISCFIALNINYQRFKLGCRRKINSTLLHSSS